MPKMDGREALCQIRALEREMGVPSKLEAKIVMTTALDDAKTVFDTYYQGGRHRLSRSSRSSRPNCSVNYAAWG